MLNILNTTYNGDLFSLDTLNSQTLIRFIPHEMPFQSLVQSYNLSDAVSLVFCGGVSILAIFILLLLVKNREKIYLHYALFLLFMLFFGIIHVQSVSLFGEHSSGFLNFNKRLVEPVTILAFGFYIFFSIELIELKKQSQKLYQLLSLFAYSNVIYALLYYLVFNSIIQFEHNVFLVARCIIFPTSLFFLVWIQLKIKSPVKVYFIMGSLAYFIGSIVATARYTIKDIPFAGFYKLTSPIYFEMGIMVEILCFALALGHRIYFLHYEKEEASKQLIHQLSINEQMTRSMNEQLEAEVEERTKEIISTQSKLREQEKKRLLAEFEKDLAKSEMLARSLQINPHFIFNCLNAIKYLIQSEQNKEASRYLVIFSKFIRMVLDSSQKNTISLTEEMEIIKNYLNLEKKRFDNDFSFEISGLENPLLDEIAVPPLILQPFVENAIWHGLLNSSHERKVIRIIIDADEKSASIAIEDNGVGRNEAKKLSTKKLYKSMSINLTKERIKLYNHNFKNILKFIIIDKTDEQGISTGTRIEVGIERYAANSFTSL